MTQINQPGQKYKLTIDALNFIQIKMKSIAKVEIYTDCQSLCDLLVKRKEKLQTNNFLTRAGKPHLNVDLYKSLYTIAGNFDIQPFKIKGHDAKPNRVTLQDKIFAVIDKLSRRELRSLLSRKIPTN